MNFVGHKKRRRPPTVIIVSLIDVLLVVLIFLMISTTLKKDQHALKLSLPQSTQSKPGAADTKPFIVSIATNAPYLYLEEQPVTFDRLQKEMVTAVQRDPALKVAIKADKLAPFGEVVRVYDAAKAANVPAISIMTEKPIQNQR